jgi:hypothetical protein
MVHVFPLFAGPFGAGPHGLDRAEAIKLETRLIVVMNFMAVVDLEQRVDYGLLAREVNF